MQSEGLGKIKNFIHLMESQTCDLPACSTVFLTTDPGVPGSIPGNYKEK
jgi:hypothetical protein